MSCSAGLTWFISGFFALIRYFVKVKSPSFVSSFATKTEPLNRTVKVTALGKKVS